MGGDGSSQSQFRPFVGEMSCSNQMFQDQVGISVAMVDDGMGSMPVRRSSEISQPSPRFSQVSAEMEDSNS